MVERRDCEDIISRDFHYGRKSISVNVNMDKLSASIRIGTIGQWWRKKNIGETTSVFLKADSFIQDIADNRNQSICLIFDTADTNLKIWARTRKDFLHFDSVEPVDIDSYRLTVRKTYFPIDGKIYGKQLQK
jgi:hypothetical protein